MAKPKKNKKSKSLITEKSNISMGLEFEAETQNVLKEANQNIFETPPRTFMPTLPNYFKSLVNQPIEFEIKEPRRVIELLGEYLGILDYKSNIAAFWFLDTLALQVLKYSINFDGKHRSIFVSWLAGEMKFIQENNPSREEFFNEMNELFCNTTVKLVSGEPLLHWNLIFPNQNERDVDDEIKELMKQRSTTKKNSRRPKESKEVRIVSEILNEPQEVQDTTLSDIQKTDPSEVLNAIVDATFEMYGSESRYALIQAAFVDPVEIHTYVLPYNLKEPRKIKLPEFDYDIQTVIEHKLNEKQSKDLKDIKGEAKSKKKNKTDLILTPPPPSMIDEEILSRKREYILPLMESYDAQKILRSKDN